MRDRLIELIRKSGYVDTWNYHTDDFKEPNPIYELADYLIDNGVIVLPCKVGDVVYLITDCTGDMRRIVTGFTQDEILSYSMKISMSALGKTVFLTREEAEQALKGAEVK